MLPVAEDDNHLVLGFRILFASKQVDRRIDSFPDGRHPLTDQYGWIDHPNILFQVEAIRGQRTDHITVFRESDQCQSIFFSFGHEIQQGVLDSLHAGLGNGKLSLIPASPRLVQFSMFFPSSHHLLHAGGKIHDQNDVQSFQFSDAFFKGDAGFHESEADAQQPNDQKDSGKKPQIRRLQERYEGLAHQAVGQEMLFLPPLDDRQQ